MGYGNDIWTVLPLSHVENIVQCLMLSACRLPAMVNLDGMDALSYYNIIAESKMVIHGLMGKWNRSNSSYTYIST